MQYTVIATENAPKAIGPYSQGVAANGFLFVSGQLPIDPQTGKLAEADFSAQTTRSMENIRAIVKEAGADMASVVKTTIFVSDLSGFAAVNEAYGKFFTGNFPARACIEARRLPKNVLVEIEAVVAL